jgi:exonuclease III
MARNPLSGSRELNGNVAERICVWGVPGVTGGHWHSMLGEVLGSKMSLVVKTVRVLEKGTRRVRFDVWVSSGDAKVVLESLRVARKHTGWTARLHVPYGDRKRMRVQAQSQSQLDRSANASQWQTVGESRRGGSTENRSVGTWNVGTMRGRRAEVSWQLQRAKIHVVGLQETLNGPQSWPLRLSGFTCIERKADPAVPGARGVALLVSNTGGLSSFELNYPHTNTVWARVGGLCHLPVTLASVYVPQPQGGDRHWRKDTLAHVKRTACAELRKNPDIPLMLMGDFNMTRPQLASLIGKWGLPLSVLEVRGNPSTFHRAGRIGRSIDHVIVNGSARGILCHGVVRRTIDTSDHWPLTASIHDAALPPPTAPAQTGPRMKGESLRENSSAVATHNFWTPLLSEMDELSASTAASRMCATAHSVAADLGCSSTRLPKTRSFHRISRKTKQAIHKRRKLNASMRQASGLALRELTVAWREAAAEAKAGLKSDNAKNWVQFVAMGATLLRENKPKEFWRWVRQLTGSGKARAGSHPVKDEHGVLQTDPNAIRSVFTAHYRKLAQDPDPHCTKWWQRSRPLDKRPRLDGINDTITWGEVNATLQALQNGKAPGEDGVPPELFKCATESKPEELPGTPLGKVLLTLVRKLWESPGEAETLRAAKVVSIPKTGDLADVDNYRGISLIAVAQKLVTKIVSDRLSTTLRAAGILVREQAGFLSREECQAQVAALVEIVQRRKWGIGKSTYAAFIDFRKAFDTVPHNALFYKLWAYGVRGRCLNFIKKLYRSSFIKVAAGDSLSEEVRLERGVRQGCPLSPILFDVFINDLLTETKGVKVPGLDRSEKVPGLMFADDAVALAGTENLLQKSLDRIGTWASDWGMETNAQKCGVMIFCPTVSKERRAESRDWLLRGERVPLVKQYKYLGIVLDGEADPRTHFAYRASQAMKALWANRSFLMEKSIPLQTRILGLKSLIVPRISHGGEVFGLRDAKLYAPLEAVLKKGLSWVLQGGGKAAAARWPVMREFDIPPVVASMAGAKARAVAKYPSLGTWARRLCETKPGTRRHTWVRHGVAQVTKLLGNAYATEYPDPTLRGQAVRDAKWAAAENRDKSMAGWEYAAANYLATRSYIKEALSHPELGRGFSWVARLRTSCFWTAYRAAGAKLLPERFRNCCPSCGVDVRDTKEHLLLTCPSYANQRSELVDTLEGWAGGHNLVNVTMAEKARLLLGGSISGRHPTLWDDHTHVARCVAQFLQEVMPRHASKIWDRAITPRVDAPDGVWPFSPNARDIGGGF